MPLDMVGPGQHGGAAAVELEAVQGPGAGRLVVGHRPGPEPALQVVGSVVHPYVSPVAFGPAGGAGGTPRCGFEWPRPWRAGLLDERQG